MSEVLFAEQPGCRNFIYADEGEIVVTGDQVSAMAVAIFSSRPQARN
jgi:hypothetical protein